MWHSQHKYFNVGFTNSPKGNQIIESFCMWHLMLQQDVKRPYEIFFTLRFILISSSEAAMILSNTSPVFCSYCHPLLYLQSCEVPLRAFMFLANQLPLATYYSLRHTAPHAWAGGLLYFVQTKQSIPLYAHHKSSSATWISIQD